MFQYCRFWSKKQWPFSSKHQHRDIKCHATTTQIKHYLKSQSLCSWLPASLALVVTSVNIKRCLMPILYDNTACANQFKIFRSADQIDASSCLLWAVLIFLSLITHLTPVSISSRIQHWTEWNYVNTCTAGHKTEDCCSGVYNRHGYGTLYNLGCMGLTPWKIK